MAAAEAADGEVEGADFMEGVAGSVVEADSVVGQAADLEAAARGAAWERAGSVVETGLYNLTKDEAPALIHFGKESTQQWLLVRLKNPDSPSGQ